jgi:hypothetical protein
MKTSICKPIASSSNKRNTHEVPKISDDVYLKCTKILEENDEDSVNNLTPRLTEDVEREINLKEEADNQFYQNVDANGKIDKTIYESRTTLETEETSLRDDCDSVNFEKVEPEKPL